MSTKHITLSEPFRNVGLILLACLIFTGCVKNYMEPTGTGKDGGRMVRFEIKVPQSQVPSADAATRAMTTVNENEVRELDILVFTADGNFDYHVSADDIQPVGSSITEYVFNVELMESGGCDLYLIANAAAIVGEFLSAQGTAAFDKSTVQTRLNITTDNPGYFSADGKWGSSTPAPILMWGEAEGVVVQAGTIIDNVKLHRMISRVNVRIGSTDFELEEVHLFNPVDRGALIPRPDAATWNAGWKPQGAGNGEDPIGKAVGPSLPSRWDRMDATLVYSFTKVTNGAAEISGNRCVNEIYLFEAPAGDPDNNSANSFLVIGGRYKGGLTTYYRMDFAVKNASGAFEYLPILRNHSYEFIINNVGENGCSTVAEAAATEPRNNIYTLTFEDDYELDHFIFYEQYYLAVERLEKTFEWDATGGSFRAKSNYENWTAQISSIPDNPDAEAPWWITPGWSPQKGIFNGTQDLFFTFEPNEGDERVAYLHLSAGGKLSEVVIIIQREFEFNIAYYFAKSNIVMKPDGSLWFATTEEENAIVPANAQGLHFKFGSLVGLNCDAPVGTVDFAPSHVVFSPKGYTAPATWSWENIPYYTEFNQAEDEFLTAYPESTGNLGFDATAGIGDICRYISDKGWVQGKWRMPTLAEMQKLNDESNFREPVNMDRWPVQEIINTSGWYGTGTFTTGWWFGNKPTTNLTAPESGVIFLPAGGFRLENNGKLTNQGNIGDYWTTTAPTADNGYDLYFIKEMVYLYEIYWYRTVATSVRCIQDYPNGY